MLDLCRHALWLIAHCDCSSFFESQQRIVSVSHALSPLQLAKGLEQCLVELGFEQRYLPSNTVGAAAKRVVVLGLASELTSIRQACRLADDDVHFATMVSRSLYAYHYL